jgi:hypothetical protein
MTKVNTQNKIITLWAVFLLGTLFHTQLGLMPLFHGLSVAPHNDSQAATDISSLSGIFWLMLGFFVLPMFAMIFTAFTDAKPYRVTHFWLTVVYSVLNLVHMVMDLLLETVFWYQIALMAILFLLGLLLNLVAFQWMKEKAKSKHLEPGFSSTHL